MCLHVDTQCSRSHIVLTHVRVFGMVMVAAACSCSLSSSALPQKLSPLLVTQDFSDWQVHRCYGCGNFTHVTHKVKGNKVLISSAMEHRSERISLLEASKDYSPIFKVVLHRGQDGEEEEEVEPRFRKRGEWGGCDALMSDVVYVCVWLCVCVPYRPHMWSSDVILHPCAPCLVECTRITQNSIVTSTVK